MSAELSYTDQGGNRDLRLMTGGFKLSHLEKESFRLDTSVETRYGESEGSVITRSHYGTLAFDLRPDDTWSPFVFTDAERDPFKRLNLRLSGGAGASYTVPNRPRREQVSVSMSLLYTYENIRARDEEEEHPSLLTRHAARWNLRLRGDQQLIPGTTLNHSTSIQPVWNEMADYLLRSDTGIRVLLTEQLALSVSYQLNRNALPPEGVEPDDRMFKTGLVINF